MKKVILLVAMTASIAACTRDESASKLLEIQGHTDIEITGYEFFSCSEDDAFKTGFRAKTATGAAVKGTVCEGWFKGKTIRYD